MHSVATTPSIREALRRWVRWLPFGRSTRTRAFEHSDELLVLRASRNLRDGEPDHRLVAAPPRCGMGVGIVVPNLVGDLETSQHAARNQPGRIGRLENLAALLTAASGRDSHWDREARRLFVALGLYVRDTKEFSPTIGGVAEMLDARFSEEGLRQVLEGGAELDPLCRRTLEHFRQVSAPERGAVCATLRAAIRGVGAQGTLSTLGLGKN